MRNKSGIIAITVILTALCIYFLSFTFVARNIQRDATQFATNRNGKIDFKKRQTYLDSLWNEPVYNLGFTEYTYKEVKDKELSLGLDLQGGMHITMEIAPASILRALSGNSKDPKFLEALRRADQLRKTSQDDYVSLFYQAYQEVAPDGRLSRIFSTAANRGRISYESSNEDVLRVLNQEVDEAIDRSFEILRTRIDKFGVANPNIQQVPGGRIQIELPGADNPARVRKLLSSAAKLEFAEVWEPQELSPYLEQLNTYLINTEPADAPATASKPKPQDDLTKLLGDSATVAPADSAQADTTAQRTTPADSAVQDSLNAIQSQNRGLAKYFVPIGGGLGANVRDTATINDMLRRQAVRAIFPLNLRFRWDAKAEAGTRGRDQYVALYAVKIGRDDKAALSGDVISDAKQDINGANGQVEVNMQMNPAGTRQWKKLTASNIGRRVAIVLDDNVYSAPTVQSEIPNGSSVISGNFTIEEAKDLASILEAGKLDAPARIVEEAVVGPSLGKEAIAQGLISMAAGLGLVVAFMLLYYSTGGMVANLALLVNVFFIIGILAQFSASLTLPGIAGIVLTIGMSVDANVLIFERIKEEMRNGVPFLKAIDIGYDKAYSSILDSNITTFLTGVILFAFGTGGIKGFAVVLIIGILCSLFTAVFITRMVMEWSAKRATTKHMTIDTPLSRNLFKGSHFDFVGFRKKAYAFSGAFIALGIVAMITNGLNLGVDFQGGRTYVVGFSKPVAATEVRAALLDDFQEKGTEVKTYNGPTQVKVTTSYLIDDDSDAADQNVRDALTRGLEPFKNLNPQVLSSSKVGATIADDIKDSSRNVVILSLIVIFIYILIRFRRWQYSLGAIVALAHDVLIVLSAFAIARFFGINYEVDQVFIAAMLTVIGYSINDTVVVFDRIREFAHIYSKQDLKIVMNDAIIKTLSRTIMTSFVTLLVVVVLFLFGGEVLRGFSFALLIGIIFGTYSSIFIASPIVLDFSRRKEARQVA